MLRFSQVTPPSLNLAVLSGGNSSERKISLATGAAVFDSLASLGHQCVSIDPAMTDLETVKWLDFDAAVIALHGPFGEDGQVQRILESKGVPFTGSDSCSSKLAFSKIDSKQRFIANQIPTPEFAVINESDDVEEISEFAETIGYPIVVKPNSEGSSFGVTIVESASVLPAALKACFQFGPIALLEKAVVGTEWTVAIIDDTALPPIRIKPKRHFYDFSAKYEDSSTDYIFDGASPDVIELVRTTALEANRCLGVTGISRVDLRLDESNRPWVLEVNTIPGMTSTSLVPKAANRAGITFAEICQRMVTGCLIRRTKRRLSA